MKAFDRMPRNAPFILYLINLFPYAGENEMLEICCDLCMSRNEGRNVIKKYYKAKSIVEKAQEDESKLTRYDWAKLYMEKDILMYLEVLAGSLSPEEKITFLSSHETRILQLSSHITRLRKKKRLLSPDMLRKYGVPCGKDFGKLLKLCEEIAVNNNLRTTVQVIQKLKNTEIGKKYLRKP